MGRTIPSGRDQNRIRRIGRGAAFGLILTAFLAVSAVSVVTGVAENSIDLTQVYANRFPVRLAAVVFAAGTRMDQNNALGFGEWAVRFGSNVPTADYHCDNPCVGVDPPPVVNIGGLICENPDFGDTSCNLAIFLRGNHAEECAIRGEENASVDIPIDCPLSLEIL
jgi:hypothetical protein